MKVIKAYTDGGSQDNPGISGWAFYIPGEIKVCGYVEEATNNEMELTAMIQCLDHIGKTRKAQVFTDSTYVQKGLTQWIYGWMKHGWKTSAGTPVANKELWQELFSKYEPTMHEILFVKGHSGVEGNEVCDQLVQFARESKIKYWTETAKAAVTSDIKVEDLWESYESMKSIYESLSDYDRRTIADRFHSDLTIFAYKVKNDA